MYAQEHVDVFPDLEGTVLLDAIQDEYKPTLVLTYGQCRDTLMGYVINENDSTQCIYTGLKKYLNPNGDPTSEAYNTGNIKINTEHVYPRSLGAGDGNARSDMHHLFPSKEIVNTARSNDPFMEINDNQTEKWFYLDQELTSKPSSNIDNYSEDIPLGFEPREAVKGDIARAMFYFYTIYRSNADNADPNYFEGQRETLCQWHLADPVDDTEWTRTQRIANVQGKANPFILDCSAAIRLYCPNQSDSECPEISNVEDDIYHRGVNLVPNPGFDKITVQSDIAWTNANVYNIIGKLIDTYDVTGNEINVDPSMKSGIYFVMLATANGKQSEMLRWVKR